MVSSTAALGVTIATLAVFTGLGIWYARGRVSGVEDLITARGTTGRGMTTATLIASSMGAWILFSPAEAGAAFGGISAVIGYGVGSALALAAYMWLGPRIRSMVPQGHSLTEYALARYGAAFYAFVLVVSLFYMFMFLAAEFTGIAGALSLVAGVEAWKTAALVGVFVVAYTAYGGLRASIFTDTVQTLVILPLMVVGFAGAIVALGGAGAVYDAAVSTDASLVDVGFGPGLLFGATVIVAILGAEMLNQTWWQRIYAARDANTLRRSFALAGLTVFPMIVLAGLFGVAAAGLGLATPDNAAVAFFVLLGQAFPAWIVLVVVLLAVLLVMSTADTLFNAIASVVTSDLPRLAPGIRPRTLKTAARVTTVVVAAGATVIGARSMSVLDLFLAADLFAAATFVPLLAGLWSRRIGGGGALVAGLAGLFVGLVYFPIYPAVNTWLAGLPAVGAYVPEVDMLWSFAGAAAVSAVVTALAAAVSRTEYDLGRLASDVRRLDEGSSGAGTPAAPAASAEGVDA